MNHKPALILFWIVFLHCIGPGDAKAQWQLHKIRIGECIDNQINQQSINATAGIADAQAREQALRELNAQALERLIKAERKRGLVLDARPFAINQSTGKLLFNGKTGRVSVVHMNPFVYRYDISVAQVELVSSAVSDFIDILLPPGLRSVGRLRSDFESFGGAAAGNLAAIERRLNTFDSSKCPNAADAGCLALLSMKDEFDDIKAALSSDFDAITSGPPDELGEISGLIVILRDEKADAYTTCKAAEDLNQSITTFDPDAYLETLNLTQKSGTQVKSLANDLSRLVDRFFEDDLLKTYIVRCGGFNCAQEFKAYAEAVISVIDDYQSILAEMLRPAQQVKALLELTNRMKGSEGVFARTFDIIKRFELSEATITVARVKLEEKPASSESARANRGITDNRSAGGESTNKSVTNTASNRDTSRPEGSSNNADQANVQNVQDAADDPKPKAEDPKPKSVTGSINQSIQIGRPRFLVSGGLVFSPLRRQTFESGTGFVRDANGNPTGDGNKNIVALGENSSRRLLPLVMLNTRLATFKPASFYFSLGVTAKHERDIDVEYLLGPSVSVLNDRALFTFGAYAGKVQSLVPDVKVGDEIPDSAGNASLFTKRYSWKPGFSFTYVFSNINKRPQEGGNGDGDGEAEAAASNDLKEEIRIGSIPFNLAMGLAYTSLEDQTFDEVLGLARDRQGNLTNGQTLTRIVGLSTNSNYRLVPMAMLHSRLLNFGRHSFYLTTGVTGKKTDDNIDVEYLLGGSVNIYRRKLFFTFGAFAGKQQMLGGDLFPGAQLDPSQDISPFSRYVWKPAFVFSYDISKILPKGSKE